MELLLQFTYSQVPIIAIQKGTIEGAWEKAIAERLQKDFSHHSPLTEDMMRSLGFPSMRPTPEDFLKAAYLIRATEPETENA